MPMLFSKDTWQEIAYTIQQNRIRSLMTVFGVFWGVFMLVILVGVATGLQNGAYSAYRSYATNTFYIWTRITTKPYKGYAIGRSYYFNNDDTRILRETIPEIQVVAPRGSMRARDTFNNVSYKDKAATLTIYGDEPQIRDINLMEITRGRFLNRLDLVQKRKVAVMGSESVPLLFPEDQNPIGQFVCINDIHFQIVGIFGLPNHNSDDYEENAKAIFLPLSTFQQTFNWGEIVGWFSINVKLGFDAEQVKEKASALLARRHFVAPNDKRAFGSWNMADRFKKMADLFTGIRFITWFVGIFTMLAGIIGISNIMVIVVRERTREIGIRRAMGASPLSIMVQLILETLVLTSVPGYVALVLGVGVLEVVDKVILFLNVETKMFQHPEINLYAGLGALVLLTLGGVFAGMIPALGAVRMKPADALRQNY